MSRAAAEARRLAARVLPTDPRHGLPPSTAVEGALASLSALEPVDAYDEVVFHEVGQLLIRLRYVVAVPRSRLRSLADDNTPA